MSVSHFLTLTPYSRSSLLRLLELAVRLKSEQKAGVRHEHLRGKTLAMLFQKPSNRTRVSFEVGMYQLGGTAIVIRPDEIQMGKRETVADIARVLSRYVDAVMMRVLRHTDIQEFAQFATVPVINGLSDLEHPCQAFSDLLTIYEHIGRTEGLTLCYVGDGNNVCTSLIQLAHICGMKMVVCCPRGYEPVVSSDAAPYSVIYDPNEAVVGADVLYTDVWTSMGQEAELISRLRAFEGYTITNRLMQRANPNAIFMHCLPAHRGEEVDSEVLDGPASVVFDQAENRLHAQKAILLSLLAPTTLQ